MSILTKSSTKTTQLTGADILVETLVNSGIDAVFGYPGSPILSVYNALSKTDKIKHYLSRHEQGAVHAAEGYARVKGKCGVVLVTSGPGVTNTITGILNAHSDRTPLVVICAQSENSEKNEFQDVDISKLIQGYSKKSYFIKNSEEISKYLSIAIHKANSVPQGPVVVAVTRNALEMGSDGEMFKLRREIKVEAPQSCVLRTLDALKNAHRPLVIVGGGCIGAEREVSEFLSLTHIPVVNTLMASGINNDLSLGMIGLNGNDYLNEKIYASDVVLALGCRFSDRTTVYADKFLPDSKIISINIEQNTSKNVRMEEEILGEMNIVLQQMIGTIHAKGFKYSVKYDWIDVLSKCNTEIISSEYTVSGVLREIHEYTKKYNPIITTDVGTHQIEAAKIFKTSSLRHYLTSGGFGTMGYGLPAAIGAHIAKPDLPVITITGDGSFQMNLQELGTLSEYNIPVKIFIINNSELNMIKTQQTEHNYNHFQSSLINPDFVQLAKSYGIFGYSVSNMSDLKQTLSKIFTYKKAVIVDIKLH